jgi:hypothetical protein
MGGKHTAICHYWLQKLKACTQKGDNQSWTPWAYGGPAAHRQEEGHQAIGDSMKNQVLDVKQQGWQCRRWHQTHQNNNHCPASS